MDAAVVPHLNRVLPELRFYDPFFNHQRCSWWMLVTALYSISYVLSIARRIVRFQRPTVRRKKTLQFHWG
jgi:hypothetical protein